VLRSSNPSRLPSRCLCPQMTYDVLFTNAPSQAENSDLPPHLRSRAVDAHLVGHFCRRRLAISRPRHSSLFTTTLFWHPRRSHQFLLPCLLALHCIGTVYPSSLPTSTTIDVVWAYRPAGWKGGRSKTERRAGWHHVGRQCCCSLLYFSYPPIAISDCPYDLSFRI